MNNVSILGRLTHAPEIKQSSGGKSYVNVFIAVNKPSKDNKNNADFISCIAWDKRAEFIAKYFQKGSLIAIDDKLTSNSYTDKNGRKNYSMAVSIQNIYFTRNSTQNRPPQPPPQRQTPVQSQPQKYEQEDNDFFSGFPNYNDDDLPF